MPDFCGAGCPEKYVQAARRCCLGFMSRPVFLNSPNIHTKAGGTHKLCFWGFKLHLVLACRGMLVSCC